MTAMELLLLVINGILVPLCGWTLKNVHTLTRQMAEEAVWGQTHAREILDIRTRLVAAEAQIIELRIKTSSCAVVQHGG